MRTFVQHIGDQQLPIRSATRQVAIKIMAFTRPLRRVFEECHQSFVSVGMVAIFHSAVSRDSVLLPHGGERAQHYFNTRVLRPYMENRRRDWRHMPALPIAKGSLVKNASAFRMERSTAAF